MIPWIVFASLTVVAVLALLWALSGGRRGAVTDPAAAALAVYKDQLSELERDRERGLIADNEAEAARNEISRRILGAAHKTGGESTSEKAPWVRNLARGFVVVAIPVMALGLYALQGRPGLPDVPHAQRIASAAANNDFPALVAQVEHHLDAHPDDVKGWSIIAPAYHRLGRFDDAANAYAQILRLKGPSPDLLADYGEALMLANQGLVGADAQKAFDQALALDKSNPKALYYSGLGMRQEGKNDKALAIWRKMLAEAPADAPWRATVAHQVAALEAEKTRPPALDNNTVAAVKDMSASDQQAMIRSMVDRLDKRLTANGDDLDGWLRLARARSVLGQKDAARQALARAEAHFKGDTAALERIAAFRKTLQLD
jgi:cytochrome c-type biogenesis protein CcmH